eukprot:TRINITY_DN62837_c0_g1_i1.p1 TRINITY_DN62837_c0_g1~~TRINITY_DN62837_c0_g1_i1.p1  ORF type:complete len:448 (-),score=105.42 TRINITY_DN62837_c0_g1_i1:99-1334(-)
MALRPAEFLTEAGGFGSADSRTLLITGFPENACDRELENFCRFMPGYVGARTVFKRWPQVFVKFQSHAHVLAAKLEVDGQPFDLQDATTVMKAHVANTELKNTTSDGQIRQGIGPKLKMGSLNELLGIQPEAPDAGATNTSWGSSSGWWSNGAKRPRVEIPTTATATAPAAPTRAVALHAPASSEGSSEMDTICIMGVSEKGHTEETLTSYLGAIDGFIALQVGAGKGGSATCFAKFASGAQARAALLHAADLEPQMARRSMNVPGMPQHYSASDSGAGANWYEQPKPQPSAGIAALAAATAAQAQAASFWGTTHRSVAQGPADMDTMCIKGAAEMGYSEESLGQYMAALDGFMGLRATAGGKGGGLCFVKFATPQQAQDAVALVRAQGLGAELARTSLNPSQATVKAPGL